MPISLSDTMAPMHGAADAPEQIKNPNPQGKGLVPMLRDWQTMVPSVRGPKAAAEFLRDYCMSSLVLAAHFRFKPVLGMTYFLYSVDDNWSLSLVGPDEWGTRLPGECLASCRLRADMTWELEVAGLDEQSPALRKARSFIRSFVDTLSAQQSIEAHLPFYVGELPYYQRLLATALSSSLQQSLPQTGDDMRALLAAQPAGFAIAPAGAR